MFDYWLTIKIPQHIGIFILQTKQLYFNNDNIFPQTTFLLL